MRRYLYRACLGLLLSLMAVVAQAKTMPPTVGGAVAYRSPHDVRVLGRFKAEINEMLSFRLSGGPTLYPLPVRGTFAGGLGVSLDTFTWVPTAFVMAGMGTRPINPLIQAGIEVERFVSLHRSLVGGVAMEWAGARHFGVLVSLGFDFET